MSRRARLMALATAGMIAAASLAAGATPVAAGVTCAGTAPSDFNGDGISDAAIGEASPGTVGHGHVHVIYGLRQGLTASASGTALDDQYLTDATDTLSGFGAAFGTGDFNGDGCSDLAVGDVLAPDAPGHLAGSVLLYYGGTTGLRTPPNMLNEALSGGTTVRDNDRFGQAIAIGDFNGDGLSDIAVGSPYTGHGGELYVYPGNRVFSPLLGVRHFIQGDGTIPGVDEAGDRIGAALASADFNGDGRGDLAIGVPGENIDRGAVFVVPGSGSGTLLTGAGAQIWTQDSTGVQGTAEEGDEFGWAVTTGSFKGNGRADLAIGVPFEGVNGTSDAGSVNVLYNAGAAGLTSTGNQLWTQTSTGVGGAAQVDANLGFSLAAGDFNGNGKTDLAAGAPWASVSGAAQAGRLTIIPGTAGGLSATGASAWSQATAGIPDSPETADHFGESLATLRVSSVAHDDLLLGTPGEVLSGTGFFGEGTAEWIPGSTGGLTATGSQLWSSDTAGIRGTACAGCGFGAAVG